MIDTFEYLGGLLIGSSALVWLAKTLFTQLLKRDVEKFKSELQSKHALEIERFRHELTLAASEHQTRFAKLHSDRAEVVLHLYRLLDETDRAFSALLAPLKLAGSETKEAMMQRLTDDASKAGNSFFRYFNQDQIFLDAELCAELAKLEGRFRRSWYDYVTVPDDEYSPQKKDHLKIWVDFRQDVSELRGKIEDRFRELLGVKAPEKKLT